MAYMVIKYLTLKLWVGLIGNSGNDKVHTFPDELDKTVILPDAQMLEFKMSEDSAGSLDLQHGAVLRVGRVSSIQPTLA